MYAYKIHLSCYTGYTYTKNINLKFKFNHSMQFYLVTLAELGQWLNSN